jgi:hypothetical protein
MSTCNSLLPQNMAIFAHFHPPRNPFTGRLTFAYSSALKSPLYTEQGDFLILFSYRQDHATFSPAKIN